MGRFALQRAVQGLLVLLVILTILFFMQRVSGDPAALLLGTEATPDQVAAVHKAMGLDEPLYTQYARFIASTAQLQFGVSPVGRRDALLMVWDLLPNTLLLGSVALGCALLLAIPVGILGALDRRGPLGFLIMFATMVGQSMPSFWLAIMLILLLAVQLHWLPAFGIGGPQHLVLPALTLGVGITARHARLIRSGLLSVLQQDYIRTARAKGATQRVVLVRHALRNALIPVITVLGIDVGLLASGAVIIETMFAWPGVGRQMVTAVFERDYSVVQASVFVISVLVIVTSVGVDLLYHYLDPRIRVHS